MEKTEVMIKQLFTGLSTNGPSAGEMKAMLLLLFSLYLVSAMRSSASAAAVAAAAQYLTYLYARTAQRKVYGSILYSYLALLLLYKLDV